MRSRYDATKTDSSNERYWVNADNLSPVTSHNAHVRWKLFTRARYERRNNSYAKGLVETIAHDTVGTGPRPQVSILDRPASYARQIERVWSGWALDRFVDLHDKLRLMDEAEITDGESFALMRTNPGVKHPVQLDLQVIECEQCGDPVIYIPLPGHVDGILYDDYRNPVAYKILRYHPGDVPYPIAFNQVDIVAAENVLHWFRPTRAGEGRGVSGLASALDRFAQVRRFEKAVLTAAETAAVLAGVMKTNLLPPDMEDRPEVEAYDHVNLEPGTMTTLPDGWDITQVKAEQPTTTFGDFKGENLDAAGRGLNAPSNIVRGHSRDYNFASGRLDYVIWHRAVRIRRRRMRVRVLDPLFVAFVAEARLIPGLLPPDLPPISTWAWQWFWDGFESIDPVKDAEANKINLELGLTTYSELLAEDGKDWEEVALQRQREMQKFQELGLPMPPVPAVPSTQSPGGAL